MHDHVDYRGLLLHIVGAVSRQNWLPESIRGRGVIICLHSVSSRLTSSFDPTRRERVHPQFLMQFISALKGSGVRFIKLSSVIDAIQDKDPRPFVCFTLDDGYRDNLSDAWPIFRQSNVPFSIFLTTDFVSGNLPTCWNILDYIISEVSEFRIKDGDALRSWTTTQTDQKIKAYNQAAALFRASDHSGATRLIDDLGSRYGSSFITRAIADVLTWDQVRELASDPLVDIGAHTVSHPVIGRLSKSDAFREIKLSKDQIEEKLNRRVENFAFPFGNQEAIGRFGIDLVREAGFKLSVTTERKNLSMSYLDRPYALPRITLDGLYQTVRQARAQISGIPSALKTMVNAR